MDAVQQIVTEVTKTHKNTFDDPTRTSFIALWTVFVIMALASITFLGQIFTSKHPNTLGSPIKRHCKCRPWDCLGSKLAFNAPASHVTAAGAGVCVYVFTDLVVVCRLHILYRHHSCSLLLRYGGVVCLSFCCAYAAGGLVEY